MIPLHCSRASSQQPVMRRRRRGGEAEAEAEAEAERRRCDLPNAEAFPAICTVYHHVFDVTDLPVPVVVVVVVMQYESQSRFAVIRAEGRGRGVGRTVPHERMNFRSMRSVAVAIISCFVVSSITNV